MHPQLNCHLQSLILAPTQHHLKLSTFANWDVFGTQVPKIVSICLACSIEWLGAKWAYLLTISTDSQPPISCRTESRTPDWISQLAHVCRKWRKNQYYREWEKALNSGDYFLIPNFSLTTSISRSSWNMSSAASEIVKTSIWEWRNIQYSIAVTIFLICWPIITFS